MAVDSPTQGQILNAYQKCCSYPLKRRNNSFYSLYALHLFEAVYDLTFNGFIWKIKRDKS